MFLKHMGYDESDGAGSHSRSIEPSTTENLPSLDSPRPFVWDVIMFTLLLCHVYIYIGTIYHNTSSSILDGRVDPRTDFTLATAQSMAPPEPRPPAPLDALASLAQ